MIIGNDVMHFNNLAEMILFMAVAMTVIVVAFIAILPYMPTWAMLAIVVAVAVRSLMAFADQPNWRTLVPVAVFVALAVRGWWVNYRRGVSGTRTVVLTLAWLGPGAASMLLYPHAPGWVTFGLGAVSAIVGFVVAWKLLVMGGEVWRERQEQKSSGVSSDEDEGRRQQGP